MLRDINICGKTIKKSKEIKNNIQNSDDVLRGDGVAIMKSRAGNVRCF